MSKKASPAAIGGFVLGAVALLVTGIVLFSGGKIFREKAVFVSYFPGTVAGLNVGAPVQFQGVQIGQVTDVKLDFYPSEGRFSIPVQYEIWADALRTRDAGHVPAKTEEERAANVRSLVEKHGLRALLTSVSLVTGQYLVTLELRADSPIEYVGADPGMIEIPAVASTRDRLTSMLEGLDLHSLVTKATSALDGISAFVNSPELRKVPGNVDTLVTDTRKLVVDLDSRIDDIVTRVDTTLDDYRTLATTATARIDSLADALEEVAAKVGTLSGNVNAQVEPLSSSALSTLKSARETLKDYEDLVAPQSATRTNLDTLLEEAAGAARSLRILADYLEQNPDALIKGKY